MTQNYKLRKYEIILYHQYGCCSALQGSELKTYSSCPIWLMLEQEIIAIVSSQPLDPNEKPLKPRWFVLLDQFIFHCSQVFHLGITLLAGTLTNVSSAAATVYVWVLLLDNWRTTNVKLVVEVVLSYGGQVARGEQGRLVRMVSQMDGTDDDGSTATCAGTYNFHQSYWP